MRLGRGRGYRGGRAPRAAHDNWECMESNLDRAHTWVEAPPAPMAPPAEAVEPHERDWGAPDPERREREWEAPDRERRERPRPFVAADDNSSVCSLTKGRKYSREQLRAIQRLLKDVAELRSTPIPTVSAMPFDDDLFKWHGNLRGPSQSPFDGGIFHIQLQFPDDYPSSPPELTLFNEIPHPFVFGNKVCLDMLQESESRESTHGWTPAYSVQSILLQLQSFLLDGLEASQCRPGFNISFSQKQTSAWKVVFDNKDQEGEGSLRPEEIRELMLEVGEKKPSPAELALYYRMLSLPEDQSIDFSTFLQILQRKREYRKVVEEANRYVCKNPKCKHGPQHPWPAFLQPKVDEFLMHVPELERIRSEMVCFYTRKSFLPPESTTLGVGISFKDDFRSGKIYSITSPLDLISLQAFRKMKHTRAADNSTTFTHWLPLYICAEHSGRAMHLTERSLGIICAGTHLNFAPDMALDVYLKLMSGLVLELQKGQVHTTVRALKGYCAFHRMLIAFLEKYPQLLQKCKDMTHSFLSDPTSRHKDQLPVLADILPLFSVVDTPLKDAIPAYLRELNCRNVLWVIKNSPAFAKEERDAKIDKTRVATTFELCKASQQLLLLHKTLAELCHPAGASLKDIAAKYDERYGLPTVEALVKLQAEYKAIKATDNYTTFYAKLGIPTPTEDEVLDSLIHAVVESKEKHYHGERVMNVQSPEFYLKAKQAEFSTLASLAQKKIEEAAADEDILLHDEPRWQAMCSQRFGVTELGTWDQNITVPKEPWKHKYLQLNLQDLLSNFNDDPDFHRLYNTLKLSAPTLTVLEHTVIATNNIKSHYHFLTATLDSLVHLQKFVLLKGESSLGPKGCRALCKGLKNNASLRILDLNYTGFTSELLSLLEEGILCANQLVSLNLEGDPLHTAGITTVAQVLKTHKSLTALNVDNCSFDDEGAENLAKAVYFNKTLKVLNIGKNPISSTGLANIITNLSYSRTIEELNASRLKMNGGESVLSTALVKLFEVTTSLKHVNFYQTQVEKYFNQATLHAISQNRSLERIDLSTSGFSTDMCSDLGWAIARNHHVFNLNLEGCSVNAKGLSRLTEAIYDNDEYKKKRAETLSRKQKLAPNDEMEELRPRTCALTELVLSRNDLSHYDFSSKSLNRLIDLTKTLTTLSLEKCHLEVAAGKALGEGLKQHPHLTALNLAGNNLGKHGVKKLCVGLRTNTVLRLLNLNHNNIGGNGAKYVAGLLAVPGVALTELGVFGNFIGYEGARCFGATLGDNHTLTALDLGLNRIRKGALEIADALRRNRTLLVLKLKLNYINDLEGQCIAAAIAGTESPTTVAKARKAVAPTATQATATGAAAGRSPLQKLALGSNRIKSSILNQIIAQIAPTRLDLADHLRVTSAEHIMKTVLCAPLPMDLQMEKFKKLFYDLKCGAIARVSVHRRKTTTAAKINALSAKYAFVEFVDKDSVELALDMGLAGKTKIHNRRFKVIQCRCKGSQ
eukprot:TRINITY_DN5538_c0_g1_i1.p1 TRINITY_DN5538_c0_g1~~TRINITY_DN5538_c0_g1_i1.p1  ORF type:complete len:1496 (-),score=401.96 TRINITY_DN5538_c0_g1_i1:47-4504(-)